MPIEITLHHTVFQPFTVRVPDACPRCAADAFQVVDELDRGDVFRPVAFYCQGCGAPIHEGKSVLLDATRIRRRIAKALDLRPS